MLHVGTPALYSNQDRTQDCPLSATLLARLSESRNSTQLGTTRSSVLTACEASFVTRCKRLKRIWQKGRSLDAAVGWND